MRRVLWVVVLGLLTGPAWALSVKDYTNQRDGYDQAQFRQTGIYLTGVASGFIWANSALQLNKQHLLFCQPAPVRLDLDYLHMIDEEIGQPDVMPDYPVEVLLLRGLQRKYPCPE